MIIFSDLSRNCQILNIYVRGSNSSKNTQELLMKSTVICDGGFRVEETVLGGEKDFSLFYTIMKTASKNYVKDVFVKFKNETIAYNYLQTVEFFSFIDMFVKKGFVSGEENSYFIVREKTENGKKRISLECKFSREKYFIYLPDAKAMWTIYNQTKIGYSFSEVLVSKVIFSYDGIIKTEGEIVTANNDDDIDELINGYLGETNVKLDDTQYFSDKVTKLLSVVKENQNTKD